MATFQLTQNQTKEALRMALKADVVAMVTSSPAMGKSSIIKQLAEEENLYLIDLRLSQVQQFDLLGLPKVVETKLEDGSTQYQSSYIPMDTFPLERHELPINPNTNKPYSGFCLFLDELNSADKYTQAAAYRLLLDREVGNGEKLHPSCRILAAGNKMSDSAIVHKMSTAVKSRIVHIELNVNPKEFSQYVEDNVVKGLWHSAILGFINFKPELINNFDPKKDTETFSSPRTLEMLSKLLQAGILDLGKEIYRPLIIGTIGESAGVDFCAFIDVMNDFPTIQQIEANPTGTNLPLENGAKYALGTYLAGKVNKSNLDQVVTYLERLPEKDLLVLAYRMILSQFPLLATNKNVISTLGGLRHKINNQP